MKKIFLIFHLNNIGENIRRCVFGKFVKIYYEIDANNQIFYSPFKDFFLDHPIADSTLMDVKTLSHN